jgi:SAM-dependent methyltransferase
VQKYYRKCCKEYHEKTFPVDPASFLTPLAAGLKPGATVLDVGCGSGRDLLWMKNRGFNVMGLEGSAGLAELAAENTGGEIIKADFEAYDFTQLSVDAIVLVGALVHLPHVKMPAVLNSIIKALKKDGKILLTLKKGAGRTSDTHGRIFYLWQDDEIRGLFNRLKLKVTAYFQLPSTIGTGEVWLGYILEPDNPGGLLKPSGNPA